MIFKTGITCKPKNRKIKVFTSDTHPYFHGSGRNAMLFAGALRHLGYDAELVSLNKGLLFGYKTCRGTVPVIRVPLWQGSKASKIASSPLALIIMAFHIIKSKQIIFFGRIMGYELLVLFAWLLRKQVVFRSTMLRADDLASIYKKNWLARWMRLAKMFYGYYAINEEFARQTESLLRPGAKLLVTPQGVDTARFVPADRAAMMEKRISLGLPQDKTVFSTIGIVCKRKGYQALFREMSKLPDNFLLVVVGDYCPEPSSGFGIFAHEMAELKEQGQRLLGNRLLFWGTTESPEEILQASDYFIFNSNQEGTPNAILEAMSCRIPIICKKLEGTEFFINESTATVYAADADICPAIESAMAGNQAASKANRAYQLVCDNFCIDKVAENYAIAMLRQ
jgi:glycosyltransferase involved in cell wall biosynthesis